MKKGIVIAGPTGVGKTALSIKLAKLLDADIISADSAQVYRGMDIGTAKITIEEMEGVPHYMLDILEFLKKFKSQFPDKDIWMWSGFTWEQLEKDKQRFELVSLCDVLIDGRFDIEKKDLNLKWKGSSNQRVIDVQKSISLGEIVEYH